MQELILLGILQEEKLHGYQLKQRADKILAGLTEISYGTLYPKLKKLELQGYVSSKTLFSDGGQEKTTYQITEEGKTYFLTLMKRLPSGRFLRDWSQFLLKVLFLKHLDSEARIDLVNNIYRIIKIEIEECKQLLAENDFDKFGNALIKKKITDLQTNIEWINTLTVI